MHKERSHVNESIDLRKEINNIHYFKSKSRLVEAEELLERLENEFPNNSYVFFERAKMYQTNSKFLEAENILKKIVDLGFDNKLAAMYELAKCYEKDGNFAQAEHLCSELLKNNYKNDHVLIILGDIANNNKNIPLAEKYYYKSSKTYDVAFARLAKLNLLNGNLKKASELQDNVNTDDYTNMLYYHNAISLAIKKFHYKEATTLMKKVEENLCNNTNPSSIYFAIKTYLRLGNCIHARELYDNYQACLEGTEYKYLVLNYLAYYDNDIKAQVENLKKLISSNSNHCSFANYNMGCILLGLDMNREAEKYFINGTNCLKLIDENNYIKLCTLYIHEKRYEEIQPYLDKLLTSHNSMYVERGKEIKLYLDKMMGNYIDESNINNYFCNQIYNYSEEKAIMHIKEHTSKAIEYKEGTLFDDSVDINKLYYTVREEIKNAKIVDYDLCDTYVLRKDNIGSIGDNRVNYIAVSTIINTDEIITMFPVASENYNSLKIIDGDENKEDTKTCVKSENKVKQLSAIDKFNKRYGF